MVSSHTINSEGVLFLPGVAFFGEGLQPKIIFVVRLSYRC